MNLVRDRGACPPTRYAVAPFVGDTEVARAIGRMIEVERFSGHSCLSALATGGLAPTTLAEVAGHSDPGFTLRCYSRDGRDESAVVADVLARASGAGFGR